MTTATIIIYPAVPFESKNGDLKQNRKKVNDMKILTQLKALRGEHYSLQRQKF